MGGKLINGSTDIDEVSMSKVAKRLASEGDVSKSLIQKIATSNIPANKKVASMSLSKNKDYIDPQENIKAQQDSRLAASILDTSDQDLVIPEIGTKGPRTAKNREFDESIFNERPGDDQISKTASKVAEELRGTDWDIEDGRRKKARVSLKAHSNFDTPEYQEPKRRTASEDEQISQAQNQFNRIIRTASKRFANGAMTTNVAARMMADIEDLKSIGVRSSRKQRQLINQIANLIGDWEA
jgi:hypothetical protein